MFSVTTAGPTTKMTTELPTQYQPAEVEPLVAARWEQAGAFRADPAAAGAPYCIVIPPPNVTAALHMGHALNNTLQDILIRQKRMAGDNAVWIPGTDHAGIATQTVVEKRVLAEEGKKRTDFPRDEFVAKIQAWKDEYEERITHQLKEMGCSCDWDRQRFTMDPVCAKAVREAFFQLFKDGLIYRGKRLVNWDPATQTALADDEVEMREVDGHFWYLKYPLAPENCPVEIDGKKVTHVTVATTRPETMLGDTAVAANPRDPVRAGLIGKKVLLPIVNRVIPIIGDDYVVLPDPDSSDEKARYASGFLKVTPAHDPNDWEIGLRHDLPVINVMAEDGSISDRHGWPADDMANTDQEAVPLGMDRYEAREAIVEWFREHHLLEEVRPYRHSVGHSYRSHVAIEPYLSDQWYVKVTDDRLAGAAIRAMADDQYQHHSEQEAKREPQGKTWEGGLSFHPPRYAKTFQTWHENIRDWCISRQLWWGHRIPVWASPGFFADWESDEGEADKFHRSLRSWQEEDRISIGNRKLADFGPAGPSESSTALEYVAVRDESDGEVIQALEKWGYSRDPDVLDTWFSSALWPFSTLGWPENTLELEKWNPGSVLCTAREIITLWVSRMVMFNLYFRGCLPFEDVFIHAMIQDGQGRKMSKSLGNGVDPLDIIHSHGSDAMRYTVASMTTNTQDVRLPVAKDPETGRNTSDKFDLGRNFANKLWNAARFALQNLEAHAEPAATDTPETSGGGLADRWILSRLARTVRATDESLEQYEFSKYAQGLYDFFWRDLCDWYIEAVKPTVQSNATQRGVLAACLDVSLRLLHPVMPFITERLWERLNEVAPDRDGAVGGMNIPAGELLVRAAWPVADDGLIDEQTETEFGFVQQVVTAIRQVRTKLTVPPKNSVPCTVKTNNALAARLLDHRVLIETLTNTRIDAEQVGSDTTKPDDAASAVIGDLEVFLHGVLDAGAERVRLEKRLAELDKGVKALNGRLGNKAYVDKAPEHLVQQTRDQLAATEKEAESVREQLQALP